MSPEPTLPTVSQKMLWTGRVMSAVPVVLLGMSGVMKILKPKSVVDGMVHYGIPAGTLTGLGVLELLCILLYVVPRTSILGAILVTGYMGGATLTVLRLGEPLFVMPVITGILAWGGLYLREPRLRSLIPLRR